LKLRAEWFGIEQEQGTAPPSKPAFFEAEILPRGYLFLIYRSFCDLLCEYAAGA
jgi:hypothetical protein